MKRAVFLLLLTISWQLAVAQINIALLHQLIAESKSEHELQGIARDKQTLNSLGSEVNSSSMGSLKTTYRQLRSRFSLLANAAGFLQVGLESAPVISEIYQSESRMLSLCKEDPLLIPLAATAQLELSGRSEMLLRFLYGIILSAGDLGQMSPSGRKLLFSHIISELRSINGALKGLCLVMGAAKKKNRLKSNPFSGFINRDRSLSEDILRRVEILKN
ncbi:hypothetical protein ASE74_04160 [Pedobacter sp. Leaf216]|uniref:hypothetical protein n=1 Tax=Pedobacter sp. Leaf216 TaxID=1735684 RepID=UPI0006FB528A|nr:hypothetical protein [Pedobacter sp. Leaf216]KQM69214.1 hypothetical protein ASE74_04160 [Pedobacter sp. Leaf216]